MRMAGASGRWVLLATVLGSSVAMLDSTVVNVALPTLGRELHTSLSGLQWTVTAYTLMLAGLILLGGALGDRFGRRRVAGVASGVNNVLRPAANRQVPGPQCRMNRAVGGPPFEPAGRPPANGDAADT
jgi:MFS transporter